MCFRAEVTVDRRIVNPRAVARGNQHAVLAAARDASAGEIFLHNHPSGRLDPSEADLALAARIYEDGLGTGIIDNEARELYVIVEPPRPRVRMPLDVSAMEAILGPEGPLATAHPGYEDRPTQRDMVRLVGDRYNEGGVAIVEAGTGTGKSLAYLVPAALWALSNGERTVVSTNTINLQEQLVAKDLPLVRSLVGPELTWSLVKGRGNYISIRRLRLAVDTHASLFEDDRSAELNSLLDWVRKTSDGSLSDLATAPGDDIWDEVRSDGDICLKARCPHFQECFYQKARRTAGGADLLVVNHALLFSDISLRRVTENWSQSAVLPAYRHVILDEGHNVEDAATSHLGAEVTRIGLFRLLARLDRNGKGVLRSVEEVMATLPAAGERAAGGNREETPRRIEIRLRPALIRARESLSHFFDAVEPVVPGEDEDPLRMGRGDPRDPSENPEILDRLDRLTADFGRLRREVEELRLRLEEEEEWRERLEGRLLDLQAVERRLESAGHSLELVFRPGRESDRFVRWVAGRGRPGEPLRNVVLAAAPVEPGPLLREALFDQVDTAVVTSATLSAGRDDFRFVRGRLGLSDDPPSHGKRGIDLPEFAFADGSLPILEAERPPPIDVAEALLPSPFDYPSQTLFGIPTDLPGQESGRAFQEATARVVLEFSEITDGGLFVLFTSHRALRSVAQLLRQSGETSRRPLFVHGEGPRHRLLADFTRSGRGVLLGTSSFWEGVDVPGDPLRGLVIQKLPFRVPTEPITQARMEAIESRGGNAFRHYLVPLASLRLKQGFGRLVRSRTDCGGILLLDDRILTRSYGRTLLSALPPAPVVKGPWSDIRQRFENFYQDRGSVPGRLPGSDPRVD